MANSRTLTNLALSFAIAVTLTSLSAKAAFCQELPKSADQGTSAETASGAIPLPPAKPRVDQLGTMENLPQGDQTILFVTLFLQVAVSVAVAIALASHLSMPPRQKR